MAIINVKVRMTVMASLVSGVAVMVVKFVMTVTSLVFLLALVPLLNVITEKALMTVIVVVDAWPVMP